MHRYSFGQQPNAAARNLVCLANALALLVSSVGKDEGLSDAAVKQAIDEIGAAIAISYKGTFEARHADNCRAKLGLSTWDEDAKELWDELMRLMSSRCRRFQDVG